METQNYFNTTNQDTVFVEKAKTKNKTQEEIVFEIFKRFKKLSASEVLDLYPGNIPLTSIRRAISNLKFSGKLVITEDTQIGLYGKPEKKYQVAKIEDKQYNMFD